MNKAFVKENDDDSGDEAEYVAPKTPGGKNYITPAGFKKLQDELRHLRSKERPEVTQTVAWAAGNGDRSENGDYLYGKKRLREIDRRMRFLAKRLESAEVVDPLTIKGTEVRFGATVDVEYQDGQKKTYAIVGLDEADASAGRISWVSPLANALMRRQIGDLVVFRTPKGEQELEIIGVRFCQIVLDP